MTFRSRDIWRGRLAVRRPDGSGGSEITSFENLSVHNRLATVLAPVVTNTTLVQSGFAPATTLTVAGTAALAADSDGPFLRYTTGAANGNAAGFASTFDVARRDWQPELEVVLKTEPDISNLRIWAGLFSAEPSASDNPAVQRAGFRYLAAGGALWYLSTRDASTELATQTGVAVEASRTYVLRLELMTDVVRFYIDDEYVGQHSGNLPVLTQVMGIVVKAATTSGARAMKFSRASLGYR